MLENIKHIYMMAIYLPHLADTIFERYSDNDVIITNNLYIHPHTIRVFLLDNGIKWKKI